MSTTQSGRIDTASIMTVRSETTSDQSTLASFGGSRSRRDVGIVNTCDFEDHIETNDTRLAPPDGLFYQWLQLRNQYMDNGQSKHEAHERALDEIDYIDRFNTHLDQDGTAMTSLREYAQQVADGQSVRFICYCPETWTCHRDVVASRVGDFL